MKMKEAVQERVYSSEGGDRENHVGYFNASDFTDENWVANWERMIIVYEEGGLSNYSKLFKSCYKIPQQNVVSRIRDSMSQNATC